MNKSESVAKYSREFLKGKSEEAIAKFNAKSIDKQYASIMTWRHNERRKKLMQSSGATVAKTIHNAMKDFSQLPELTLSDVEIVENELGRFASMLETVRAEFRQKQVEKLMEEKAAIEARLRELGVD